MPSRLEVAFRAAALLGEGPTWDASAGRLLWVDILACEVHRLDPGSGEDSVLRTQQHVGAAKPRARGGLVVNLRDGVGLYDPDGGFRWLASLAVQGCRGNDAAVDAAGCVWAASWDGGAVRRWTPSGRLDRTVEVPAVRTTACAFGGPDLGDLYITTATVGLDAAQAAEQPLAGSVFVLPGAGPGLEGHPFAG